MRDLGGIFGDEFFVAGPDGFPFDFFADHLIVQAGGFFGGFSRFFCFFLDPGSVCFGDEILFEGYFTAVFDDGDGEIGMADVFSFEGFGAVGAGPGSCLGRGYGQGQGDGRDGGMDVHDGRC